MHTVAKEAHYFPIFAIKLQSWKLHCFPSFTMLTLEAEQLSRLINSCGLALQTGELKLCSPLVCSTPFVPVVTRGSDTESFSSNSNTNSTGSSNEDNDREGQQYNKPVIPGGQEVRNCIDLLG